MISLIVVASQVAPVTLSSPPQNLGVSFGNAQCCYR